MTHITGSLESGDDLLSRAVASQVPSARRGLTSVFGMGTGGSLLPLSPEIVFNSLVCSFVQGSRLENHTGKADLEFTRSRMFACGIPPLRSLSAPLLSLLFSDQALDRLVSASSNVTALSPLTYRLIVFKGSYSLSRWESSS